MRRSASLTAFWLALALLLPATAQVPRRAVALLQRPEIQQELRLTDPQKASLQKLQEEFGKLVRTLRTLPERERQQRFARFRDERERRLVEILTPEQRRRLHQIELQQMGPRILLQSDIALDLQITAEQTRQLHQHVQAETEQLRRLYEAQPMPSPTEAERLREEAERVRQDTEQRLLQVLTPPQREQFERLLGEPFRSTSPPRAVSEAAETQPSPASVTEKPAAMGPGKKASRPPARTK